MHRLGALAMGSVLAGPLLIGASLSPDGRGHGTHEQLGLTPCLWAARLDTPCPTCGMTTAVTSASTGDLGAAFATQPLGATIAIGAAAGVWGCLHAAVGGSRVQGLFAGLTTARAMWILGFLALAAWIYKIVVW